MFDEILQWFVAVRVAEEAIVVFAKQTVVFVIQQHIYAHIFCFPRSVTCDMLREVQHLYLCPFLVVVA